MLKLRSINEGILFGFVGAAATASHFSLYFLLLPFTTHIAANGSAYLVATLVGYAGNRWITFRNYRLLVLNYVCVSVVSLVFSSSIAFVLGDTYGYSGLFVFCIITLVGLALSYTLQKRFSVRVSLKNT